MKGRAILQMQKGRSETWTDLPMSHSQWVAKVKFQPSAMWLEKPPSSSKKKKKKPLCQCALCLVSFAHRQRGQFRVWEWLQLPVDEWDHSGKELLVQARGHPLNTLHACHLEPWSGKENGVGILWSRPCWRHHSRGITTGLRQSPSFTHIPSRLKFYTHALLGPSSSVYQDLQGPP